MQNGELLVATTNRGKLREIRPLLAGLSIELVTLDAWPSLAAPEETGRTFEENARLKARYYAAATGLMTVAEDSGLEIDALGGAPGVESARYGGADASYQEKFRLIYDALRAREAGGSPARFVCALANSLCRAGMEIAVGSPDALRAATAADGPGTGTTRIVRETASRTSLYPGSEIMGVPASLISAIFSPRSSREINSAERSVSLCS